MYSKSLPNDSGIKNNEIIASAMQMMPMINAEFVLPTPDSRDLKPSVIGTTAPRTKLGTVVVTVARMLVPKDSDAIVTNKAQYPVAVPIRKHIM